MSEYPAPEPIPAAAAAWYPDPSGTPRMRWWDGIEWTQRYAPYIQAPMPSAEAVIPMSKLAVWGFVLSLVGLLFIASTLAETPTMVALGLSIAALKATKRKRGRGLAIAGLVISSVCLLIIILMVITRGPANG